MNQFHIVCKACTARLKVTKPSMIGKMLACPKCGTMLQIKPPRKEDRSSAEPMRPDENLANPPSAPSLKGKDSAIKTVLSQTDFDEIDILLKNQKGQLDPFAKKVIPADQQVIPADQAANSAEKAANQTAEKPSEQTKRSKRAAFREPPATTHSGGSLQPATGATAAELPLLPDDQWVHPETQQRKKRLMMISAVIAPLILLLALSAAWYNRQVSDPTIAKGVPQPVDDHLLEQKEAPGDHQPQPTEEATAGLEEGLEPGMEEKEAVDLSLEVATVKNGQLVDEPPPLIAPTEPKTDRVPSEPVPAESNQAADHQQLAANGGNPTGSPESREIPPTREPIPPTDAEVNGDADANQLAELLESSGFSLTSMRDLVTSLREEQSFGIPKYHFQQGAISLPDLNRQLEIPLPYLKYEQAHLSSILRDITDLTGIPLTIEPASVRAVHQTIDPQLSIELNQSTIGKGLDEILALAGLIKVPQERGSLVIFAEGFDQSKIVDHPLPNWSVQEPEQQKILISDFINGTKKLVFPMSWETQPNPARIWLEDEGIKVFQLPVAHHQIAELIAKVNAALALAKDPLDTAAIKILFTKNEAIASKLEQPSGLSHQLSQSFSSLLRQLQRNTGVSILADWESLNSVGWAPDTKVPGTFSEPSLKKVLDEMTRSMGITYVIFDQQTVLLTTFDTATSYSDLEVYSFGKILSGKLNQNQALSLLYRSIGDELSYPNVQVVYEPQYLSLIVVAPQLIQRRVAAVLKALEEI